jgi:hypothetical protein
MEASGGSEKMGDIPPVYRIDLSLPPGERYVGLAEIYLDELRSLTSLFDDVVGAILPGVSLVWVKRLARLFLRKVYTSEETEELKGISRVTGIDMYLLVALNVLLDLLMGCTSGAAMCKDPKEGEAKMLHFRTLDWGMDGLRKMIVQLEYVRSPETDKVLATSVTYVGFVGVLTAVRKDLSVSLNFRPNHDMRTLSANIRFYGSHLLVLLGVRQSISSLLRQYILPSPQSRSFFGRFFGRFRRRETNPYELQRISSTLPRTPTTAAYLILCDGKKALVLEKDHRSAVTLESTSFIVATNSDLETASPTYEIPEANRSGVDVVAEGAISMGDLILDSNERRGIMQGYWDRKLAAQGGHQSRSQITKPPANHTIRRNPLRKTRSSKESESTDDACRSSAFETYTSASATDQVPVTATLRELIKWTTTYPITNEMTHFSAIMDPAEGRIAWIKRYMTPLEFEDE